MKPTRQEAERKAFWKRALTVAGAVTAVVVGILRLRRPKPRDGPPGDAGPSGSAPG